MAPSNNICLFGTYSYKVSKWNRHLNLFGAYHFFFDLNFFIKRGCERNREWESARETDGEREAVQQHALVASSSGGRVCVLGINPVMAMEARQICLCSFSACGRWSVRYPVGLMALSKVRRSQSLLQMSSQHQNSLTLHKFSLNKTQIYWLYKNLSYQTTILQSTSFFFFRKSKKSSQAHCLLPYKYD